ncbi:MAG: hypothetical protein JRJ85_24415, partial [Deltaproteobacteria bacterium]|nr:hypothetical protein [Deltaproteobacteria bacterium]
FSSPEGDVPVSGNMMQRPFILRPLENHPFLTLGDFFHAIRDFVWQNNGKRLCGIIGRLKGQATFHDRIDQLIIRYEKYGTLYQIASVEATAENLKEKLTVTAAVTPEARETLNRECKLLNRLIDRWPFPFIPRIYIKDQVEAKTSEKAETFAMVLSDWFEGYHEWHFSGDRNTASAIDLWDMGQGFRPAPANVVHEIIGQAAMILTLYYDPVSYSQIFPWHHGAGDFVVKVDENGVDVRLISVRGYDPLVFLLGNKQPGALEALLFFFLDGRFCAPGGNGGVYRGDPPQGTGRGTPRRHEGRVDPLFAEDDAGGATRPAVSPDRDLSRDRPHGFQVHKKTPERPCRRTPARFKE